MNFLVGELLNFLLVNFLVGQLPCWSTSCWSTSLLVNFLLVNIRLVNYILVNFLLVNIGECGDHSLVCGTGGERIVRHNAVRDAIFDTAAAAGLAPLREGRALLPGNNRRPADVFLPHWAGGLDAALD